MLQEQLPGTSVAERARAELERIAKGLVDGVLSMPPDDLDMGGPMASLPAVSPVDVNGLEARAAAGDGSRPANVETDPNNESRSILLSQKGKETRRAGIVA